MSFCTQCGKLLQEGQICDCVKITVFCTQCGKPLSNGQICNCTHEQKPEPQLQIEPKPEPKLESKPVPQPQSEPKPEPKPVPQPQAESKPEPKPEPKPKIEPKPEPKPEPQRQPIPKPEFVPNPQHEPVHQKNIEEAVVPMHPIASTADITKGDMPKVMKQQKNTNAYVEKPTIKKSIKNMSKSMIHPPDTDAINSNFVPRQVNALNNEVHVKQYHIAHMRNVLRINRAAGYLEVTNKRIIFKAEDTSFNKKSMVHREYDINKIAGIEAVNNYRISIIRIFIGLLTLVAVAALAAYGALWFTHGSMWAEDITTMVRPPLTRILLYAARGLLESWYPDIGLISLGVGLAVGFGGIALVILLRGRMWLKLIFFGMSLGGFGVSALTYNVFAFVLLIISIIFALFGTIAFAWIPDFLLSIRSNDGTLVHLVKGQRFADVFFGTTSIGYAEAAPTSEVADVVRELGEIIEGYCDI